MDLGINIQVLTAANRMSETVYSYRTRWDVHLFTCANALVGALAVNLDGRNCRRFLHDVAGECGNTLINLLVCDVTGIGGGNDLAFRIISGGRCAKADRGLVDLVRANQVSQQLRATFNASHQHARGHGVERARVAHLPGVEYAPQASHHIVTSETGGLIHNDKSGSCEGISHAFKVCRSVLRVKVLRGLSDIPAEFGSSGGTVVTIGVFDGVHRGHQLLISQAVQQARELGVPSVVMTFDPHPRTIFAPESAPPQLMPFAQRAEQIAALGVDYLLVIDFRKEVAGLSPQAYVEEVLVGALHARHVLVGENFTFGADAAGTAQTMLQLCDECGVAVTVVQLLGDDEGHICSTAIRNQLAQGKIADAREYIGRDFSVVAPVERGAGRGGRELGYPTANQYVPESAALPGDGVYAGWFTVIDNGALEGDMEPGVAYPAAISVGTNPTFGDERRSVESYVLDREADLYERLARVEFVAKVRDMVKFDSVDELLENMSRDVTRVREILGA